MYIAIILTAIVLDQLLGDPPTVIHPVGWMGRLIGKLWDERPKHGSRWLLFLWGVLIAFLPSLIIFFIMGGFERLYRNADGLTGFLAMLMGAVLLKAVLSVRSLISAVQHVRDHLHARDLRAAAEHCRTHLVSRPLDEMDEHLIASAAIESLTENFTDSFASPLLYYAFGGLGLAWAYRYVNTADAMIGYRNPSHEWGGKAAARLDDVLNWIPARISGAVFVLACALSGRNIRKSAAVMFRDAKKSPSPNSGWTMAAAAGALGLRLEKQGVYIINPSGRPAKAADLNAAINLFRLAGLIFLFLIVLVVLILWGFGVR